MIDSLDAAVLVIAIDGFDYEHEKGAFQASDREK